MNKGHYRSLFSYYGGKSKIINLYPKPSYDTIIEPFAGGASYALAYLERNVIINDLDEKTFAIWKWATSRSALTDFANVYKNELFVAGNKISEIVGDDCPKGLLYLLQSEANQGTQGCKGIHDQITERAEKGKFFDRLARKLEYFCPRISHWTVLNRDFREIDNKSATWFVDPPYNNQAGKRYRTNLLNNDFGELKKWCLTRHGQVIICENEGANWLSGLDTTTVTHRLGFKSRYQKSTANEICCEILNTSFNSNNTNYKKDDIEAEELCLNSTI